MDEEQPDQPSVRQLGSMHERLQIWQGKRAKDAFVLHGDADKIFVSVTNGATREGGGMFVTANQARKMRDYLDGWLARDQEGRDEQTGGERGY